ncbi:MAG: nuclear transport factor 2 family protein [Pseudomonadota bacterium]
MTQSRILPASAGLPTRLIACAALAVLAGCAASSQSNPHADIAKLEAEVAATETAFAATMARRDFTAFADFIAQDAVFFSGPEPLRGKAAVTGWWRRFYTDAAAPFTWKPETVRVLESGGLAISTGPVTDGTGQLVSTYTSVWRREDGRWRIIFDRGNDVCRCAAAP